LVKKDPDKPRGRKAAVKADPADDCWSSLELGQR
jgi:hypothetical protein